MLLSPQVFMPMSARKMASSKDPRLMGFQIQLAKARERCAIVCHCGSIRVVSDSIKTTSDSIRAASSSIKNFWTISELFLTQNSQVLTCQQEIEHGLGKRSSPRAGFHQRSLLNLFCLIWH
jgi:hypothetical protein